MKKHFILLSFFFLLFLPGISNAAHVNLTVHDFKWIEGNKLVIQFSVENTRKFDIANTSLCFMITYKGKPVACKELKMTIPADADGSKIYKTILEIPGDEDDYRIKYTVYHSTSRYIIEEWFKGCTGHWKSNGNDKLEENTGGL